MQWTEHARSAIKAAIPQIPKWDEMSPAERKKALSPFYPFIGREHWPYKTWLDECSSASLKGHVEGQRVSDEPITDLPLDDAQRVWLERQRQKLKATKP